jgi:glycosyltransferase involved in cell wall biosynthesis
MIEAGLRRELAISSFVAQSVGGSLQVLHNGVAESPQSETHDSPVLLLAQRLEREKSTDVGNRAWFGSELPAGGWHLVVAGVGSERGSLAQLVSASAHPRSVTFRGHVRDMASLYAGADALLAPAPAEPLGLTVIEAMARGLPVIAAGGGGHLETLATAPEGLFSPGDVAACSSALNKLLDPGWRRDLGLRLRRAQQTHFEIQEHVRQLRIVYESLL